MRWKLPFLFFLSLNFLLLFFTCLFGPPQISQAVQETEQEDAKVAADPQAPKSTKKPKAATGGCQTSSTRREKKGKQKGKLHATHD